MENKTCGECNHEFAPDKKSCLDFEPLHPTNGDVIRQGGDDALMCFRYEHRCDICAYAAPIDDAPACRLPDGKVCSDGILAWLNSPVKKTALEKSIDIHEEDYLKDINAPAESEIENE